MKNNYMKTILRLGFLTSALILTPNTVFAGQDKVVKKAKLKGFVLRGDVEDGAPGKRSHFDDPTGQDWASSVDGLVITAEWGALQPTMDGEIASDNIIDQAIQKITDWNVGKAKGKQLFLKLRVFAGIYSPKWVGKAVGSIDVDYKNSKQGTLPYFWTDDFQKYWADFQLKLAERYDNQPLILDVALSGCMTHNAETMWRNYSAKNDTTIETLKAVGLNIKDDEACLLGQIDAAANAWKSTNISMAINSWKDYDKKGYPLKSSFVQKMVNRCSAKLGSRCIVGNNSVGNTTADKNEHSDKDKGLHYVSTYKRHTYIQTTTVADNIQKAILYGATKLHASMAELPKLSSLEKASISLDSTEMQAARKALKKGRATKKNRSNTRMLSLTPTLDITEAEDVSNSYQKNISSMFRVNSTLAYALREDGRYSKYSLSSDSSAYIKDIKNHWPASVEKQYTQVSGSFLAPNDTAYIFLKNGTYLRYYYSTDTTQGPFNTARAWHGMTPGQAKKIVAVLPWIKDNTIYFFLNNGKYIKYDWKSDRVLYARKITETTWPGLSAYAKEITGAIKWDGSKGYIFLTGNRYVRYDYAVDRASALRRTSSFWSGILDD